MHKYGKLSIINCQLSIPQNRDGVFNISGDKATK